MLQQLKKLVKNPFMGEEREGKCLETLKSQTDWIMGSTFLLGFCVNERVSKSSLHIYCTYIWQAEKVIPIVQNKLVYTILMCVYCFFQAECQNHIRIVVKLSEELLLLCGTHAYKPKCRHYTFKVCYFWYKSST